MREERPTTIIEKNLNHGAVITIIPNSLEQWESVKALAQECAAWSLGFLSTSHLYSLLGPATNLSLLLKKRKKKERKKKKKVLYAFIIT